MWKKPGTAVAEAPVADPSNPNPSRGPCGANSLNPRPSRRPATADQQQRCEPGPPPGTGHLGLGVARGGASHQITARSSALPCRDLGVFLRTAGSPASGAGATSPDAPVGRT